MKEADVAENCSEESDEMRVNAKPKTRISRHIA